jgi:hypothetical protein
MTYEKNLKHIKEAIYTKLVDSKELDKIVDGNIMFAYPEKTFDFDNYPAVTYQIINESNHPYNDSSKGLITSIDFVITIISESEDTDEIDDIDSIIKNLLNGEGTLDTDNIISYSCYWNTSNQMYDSRFKKCVSQSFYTLRTAPKPTKD